jgi:hypothetical protein
MTSVHQPGEPGGGAQDVRHFQLGSTDAQYPKPASAKEDGTTITTGTSPWLGIRCRTCNQTFRRGDRVRLDPVHGIQHLVPGVHCAPDMPSDTADGAPSRRDTERFTAGLVTEWPPLNGAPVRALTEQDWQVTRPGSGPASAVCPGCGHTFRAGDTVIICPCAVRPDDVRRESCELAVHRDPAAGLACWDDWRPSGRLIRCPRTYEKLPD